MELSASIVEFLDIVARVLVIILVVVVAFSDGESLFRFQVIELIVAVRKSKTFRHDDGVEISVRRLVMGNVSLKFSKVRLTNLAKITPHLHSFLFIKKIRYATSRYPVRKIQMDFYSKWR